MSFTTEDAENVIRKWAEAVTGCPFYHLNESIGRPNGLYGDVRFLTTVTAGTPVITDTDEEISGDPWVKHELNSWITAVFSINAYRKGARQVIATLQNGLYASLPSEILQLANIGFVSCSQSQDLTQIVEAKFEERAFVDMTFNLFGYFTEDLNTITEVTIQNLTANIESKVSK